MKDKQDIINQEAILKNTLIEDDGKRLVFRKKFSIGSFIFWLVFTGIGAAGYAIYHFTKPKKYIDYKK